MCVFLVCTQAWAVEQPGAPACLHACARCHVFASVCVSAYVCLFGYLCTFQMLFSKCVYVWVCVCVCVCVCPGAMGANLHTVITRCQTPPHWLWHVNYTPCFHLLWWHKTHIKRCTVCVSLSECLPFVRVHAIIVHLTEKLYTCKVEYGSFGVCVCVCVYNVNVKMQL